MLKGVDKVIERKKAIQPAKKQQFLPSTLLFLSEESTTVSNNFVVKTTANKPL
jgi:hypothetical protein